MMQDIDAAQEFEVDAEITQKESKEGDFYKISHIPIATI